MYQLSVRILISLFLIVQSSKVSSAERVALVIGNGSYAQTKSLSQPARDSRVVAAKLKELDFDVTHEIDRTKSELDITFSRFIASASGADVAVIFFSGYGLQIAGRNYVVPIDARLRSASDADFELIAVEGIVSAIKRKARITLLFFDASRENPFLSEMRGLTRDSARKGFAPVRQRSQGLLISFAAEPGQVSSVGNSSHSPYTTALIKHLGTPDASISQVLVRVRRTVYELTSGRQLPRDYNSLLDEFVLVPSSATVGQPVMDVNETNRLNQELSKLEAELARLERASPNKQRTRRLPVGKPFRDCGHCPEMVVVPSGSFIIGSAKSEEQRLLDEGPQTTIEFDAPFAVGRYEVSRGEIKAFVKATGKHPHLLCWNESGFLLTDDHPAVCISWAEASAYVAWLARTTGKPYRLLSEAEWEYVARAGTTTMYHVGSRITGRLANYRTWFDIKFSGAVRADEDQFAGPAPIQSLKPNAFGLYHVHGNVSEWVQDCYVGNYKAVPRDGSPYEKPGCLLRGHRGGSWSDKPWLLRSAHRGNHPSTAGNNTIGFRVARGLNQGEIVIGSPKRLDVITSLQRELKRLGCLAGPVDGKWGPMSRRALEAFNRHSNSTLAINTATLPALEAVSAAKAQVCAARSRSNNPSTQAQNRKPKRVTSSSARIQRLERELVRAENACASYPQWCFWRDNTKKRLERLKR